MKKVIEKLILSLFWIGILPLLVFNVVNSRSMKEGWVRTNPWEVKKL